MAQWAEEMKRCQSIMTEMASCQRSYEQKAYDAEEKLRKWRKDNPQKGDGKKGAEADGKKGANDKPGGKMSEKEIRQAAKAAVARSGGKSAVELDEEEVGRVGRKVYTVYKWTPEFTLVDYANYTFSTNVAM